MQSKVRHVFYLEIIKLYFLLRLKFFIEIPPTKEGVSELLRGKQVGGERQGTFDFLGFTFYLGKTLKGRTVPKLKTIRTRLRDKLKKVAEWTKQNRHKMKLRPLWKRFCSKLAGHCQYYGISHNFEEVSLFFHEAIKIFFKWINRRSQKRSFTWDKFILFMGKYPPPRPEIVHRLF